MKRSHILILTLIVLLGLGAWVTAAQASNLHTALNGKAQEVGSIQVKVRQAGRGNIESSVAIYDGNMKVVFEGAVEQGRIEKGDLPAGEYRVVAANDLGQDAMADAVPVYARQVTTLEMDLKKAQPEKASLPIYGWGGCGGASGDGRILKVSSGWGAQIVYKQCGKVVGMIGTPSCTCGQSGAWRYTTKCEKINTVVITLPCPRRRP